MADEHLHPLMIEGLRQREEQDSPILLLRDDAGRQLEIPIGLCEGLAIQAGLDQERISRPLTHDLMLSLIERCQAHVSRIIIDDYSGGTYFARMILNTLDGPLSLDCRPSDGIALALRARVPVLASETVMEAKRHDES